MIDQIDLNSSKAIYIQLLDIFIDKIKSEEWPVRSKILSEKEICAKYGVSRITARKTVEELEKKGFVEKVQGKGTFVKKKRLEQKLNKVYRFRDDLAKKGIATVVNMQSFSIIPADSEVAENLRLEPGNEVFMIERLFISQGEPYAKEISYIPRTLCRDLNAETILKNGLYKSLSRYEIFPDKAVEQLKVGLMTSQIAEEMNREKGVAYIEINRTSFSGDIAFEYTTSNVCGDMFTYTVVLLADN